LHQKLENIGTGKQLALIAGDWLLLKALRIVNGLDFSPTIVHRLLDCITQWASTTAEGAATEITLTAVAPTTLKKSQLIQLYKQKTAGYSFICPLQAGAITANANDDTLDLLARIGEKIGVAYQIRDDLNELQAARNEDVKLKRPTILLWYAFHLADSNERETLESYLNTPRPEHTACNQVADILRKKHIIAKVREELTAFSKKTITILDNSQIPHALATELTKLAQSMIND